jgi:endonuclease/exonuclease/phosphatase family metal-dependent hydrolase
MNVMDRITDPRPQSVIQDMRMLQQRLDDPDILPPKALDRNLLIATWNIRALGGLTQKWESDPQRDSPKRDLSAILCIAEIISRFDVVAIQEVKNDHTALRNILHVLGPDWGLMLTDESKGLKGNNERIAFLFDTRQVVLSGLACELVFAKEQLKSKTRDGPGTQFDRTPYAVGFRSRSSGKSFTLVALHVRYGSSVSDRIPELRAIARWLADWAKDKNAWDHNLIVLGDFNIPSAKSSAYKAFLEAGLQIPQELHQVVRMLQQDPNRPLKQFDQIAWFDGTWAVPALDLDYLHAGNFDFGDCAMVSRHLSRDDLEWYLSDHFPLWVEFSVRDG